VLLFLLLLLFRVAPFKFFVELFCAAPLCPRESFNLFPQIEHHVAPRRFAEKDMGYLTLPDLIQKQLFNALWIRSQPARKQFGVFKLALCQQIILPALCLCQQTVLFRVCITTRSADVDFKVLVEVRIDGERFAVPAHWVIFEGQDDLYNSTAEMSEGL
jgi:hypothetical protein